MATFFSSLTRVTFCLLFTVTTTSSWAQESTTAPAQEAPAEQNSQQTVSTAADEQTKESQTPENQAASQDQMMSPEVPDYFFEQHSKDIAHYLMEVSSVLVGIESFALLEKKSVTPVNKGIVLLLPDWHDFLSPSQHIAHLAQSLPALGYSTISIQPLAKPQNYPSIALTEVEQAEQNQKIIDDYLQSLEQLMNAVMEKAQQQQGAIIVITAGNNTGFLMSLYHQERVELPQAMIMLSGYQLTQQNNAMLASQLSDSDLPILDLYLKYDNLLVAPNVLLRKQEAQRNLKAEYRQYQLTNFETGYYPQEPMTRAIISWLKAMGW